MLKFAIICLHDTLIKDMKNSQETPQIWAFHGILRRLKSMIKVLFVCHGSILKSPEKVCKIHRFIKQIGTYYTTTTPFVQ